MGAAQHQGIQHAHIPAQKLPHQRHGLGGIAFSLLHQLHHAGGVNPEHPAVPLHPLHEGGELPLPQGHIRGHDAHGAAGMAVAGQLQGGLDAHDDPVGIFRTQVGDGGGGGSVAGHHQCLAAVLHQKPPARSQGQRAHLLRGLFAIGGVGAVAEIVKPLLWHQPPQLPQHTDTAHTGVKNGNIGMFVHDAPPDQIGELRVEIL